jgi:hypothetical protein
VEDNDLRKGVISLYHDSTTAGHPGITKTLWSISRDFWWPNMKDTITNYIKGCALCQSRKNNPTNPKPPPFPIPSDTYTLPFESIALDFITKLPNSHTYDTILTITDMFSKASIFIPCNETIDSEKPPSFTPLMYYPITDYPHASSRTETHASHPPSQKNSADSYKSIRTSAPPITPKLMDSQNAPING